VWSAADNTDQNDREGSLTEHRDVDRRERPARRIQQHAIVARGGAGAAIERGERIGDRIEGEARVMQVHDLPPVDEPGRGQLRVLVPVAEVEVAEHQRVAGLVGQPPSS